MSEDRISSRSSSLSWERNTTPPPKRVHSNIPHTKHGEQSSYKRKALSSDRTYLPGRGLSVISKADSLGPAPPLHCRRGCFALASPHCGRVHVIICDSGGSLTRGPFQIVNTKIRVRNELSRESAFDLPAENLALPKLTLSIKISI